MRRAGLLVVQTLLPFFGCRDASVVVRFCRLVFAAWEPVGSLRLGTLPCMLTQIPLCPLVWTSVLAIPVGMLRKASQELFVVGCLVVPIATCQSCRLTSWLQCNISATIILGSMLGSVGFHIQLNVLNLERACVS